MTILIIAEHDNIELKRSTLNAVTAATEISMHLDGQIHVLVVGHHANSVKEAASQILGVSKVLWSDGTQFEHGLAENVANQVLRIAANYSHILFPATAAGKSVAE